MCCNSALCSHEVFSYKLHGVGEQMKAFARLGGAASGYIFHSILKFEGNQHFENYNFHVTACIEHFQEHTLL